MTATVNNVQSAASTSIASYTPSSVSNSVLVVIVMAEDVSPASDPSAVSFGASSLTKAVDAVYGPDGFSAYGRAEIWYLSNPGTTAATISVTGSEAARTVVWACTLGADGALSADVTATNTGNSITDIANTFTPTGSPWIAISGISYDNSAATVWTTDQTAQTCTQDNDFDAGVCTQIGTGTSLQTHSWGFQGNSAIRVALATVSFKEAAGGTTHATSGTLTGPGSTVAGTAAHIAIHATSGALAGQGATVAGTAARTRDHATTGVLAGPGAEVAGTAAHIAIHATSGALTGPGASVAGTAARTTEHATSGVLAGQGSEVSGTAERSADSEHPTSGSLTGQGSVIEGTADRTAVHATSGVLAGQGASVAGTASVIRTHATSGELVGPGAELLAFAQNGTEQIIVSGGVKKKPQARFLRRAPKLPWEQDEEEAPAVTIAPPRRKRIPLPKAERLQEALGPIPIQTVREIDAPVITIPEIGTAVLQAAAEDDDEWLYLI